ncbi:hypothetical protein G6011_11590 [Alternaria panax]|uniref:Uncharacterized protein n=1 Tax=Alternaria panax TaxID=48097 RepID=A0AAD4IEB2_9PLEO|nr:hypothetical protein G6011_11590 [Alternaria panax]
MSHALVALPTGTDASWLNALPPCPHSHSPPHRTPRATPQMLSRIYALHDSLSIIKLSLNTRIHMSLSHKNFGYYCVHCTPRAAYGACGPTCPLLRPKKSHGPFFKFANKDWYRQLASDKGKYREITNDMAARGTAVYASTVARWERAVAKLRKRIDAPSEYWESEGWPYVKIVDARKRIEFKREWNFEEAWGRGPGLEGEVATEVKRKPGESGVANGGHKLVEVARKRVRRI